jgi:hypothetical protein
MPTAQTDPVGAAKPDVADDDREMRVYAWYDPDAAAYDLPDPLAGLDPLSDEDSVPPFDWG